MKYNGFPTYSIVCRKLLLYFDFKIEPTKKDTTTTTGGWEQVDMSEPMDTVVDAEEEVCYFVLSPSLCKASK